ncbi:proton-conducting transporter transmembrane domain-containing protein [Sulfuracidifex tepidarius]|uniref:NADH:quinone oxidoreductase/Mrp antiporter transmembrane domain-containing protein n=1 Tax=Sulfuracidifex tepidarius TaxID=1294262 RepID=A0A510DU96_9CREN|nr:proton-conducting transporter membrane subunit [Sulfuracidifex tepidarius]BBG23598.1 hypothetical protein IC006_0886 [Sulfuracidifex tepidarius]BBG26345.1 hypothetical protein IC007_0853 [Sulfuracidifex tepidarius]
MVILSLQTEISVIEVLLFIISFLISMVNRRLGYLSISLSSAVVIGLTLTQGYSPLNLLKILASFSWLLLSLTSRDSMSPMVSLSIAGMMAFMDSTNFFIMISGWEVMAISLFYAIKSVRGSVVFLAFGELSTVLLIAGASIAGEISKVGVLSGTLLISGFLVKTGITPFYGVDWFPLQEGKLPHSASALISATMTLMGIYGSLEVFQVMRFEPLAYVLIVLGGFTAFLSSLYGYVSDDGRASLAFSSIENSGAMVTALGIYALGGITQGVALASLLMIAVSNSIGKTGAFLNSVSSITLSKPFTKNAKSYAGMVMIATSLSGLLPTAGGIGSWGILESLFIQSYLSGSLGVISLVGGIFIALAEGFATALILKYASFRHFFRRGSEHDEDWIPRLVSGLSVLALGILISYLVFPKKGGLLGVISGTLILTYSTKPFGGISPLYIALVAGIGTLVTMAVVGRPKGRRVKVWNNGVDKEEDYTPFAMANNERVMLKVILGTERFSRDAFLSFFALISKKYRAFSDALAKLIFNGKLSVYVAYLLIAFILILILASLYG